MISLARSERLHLTGNPAGSSRRTGPIAVFVAALVFALAPVQPSFGQTTVRPNSNVPFGTPTSPDDAPTTGADDFSRPPAVQADPRIEAVDINGSNRARDAQTVTERLEEQAAIKAQEAVRLKPLTPSQFENFAEQTLGRKLPRFGADLLLPGNRDYAVPATATVPPDYALNVGDTVSIALAGSVDGSVSIEIDTNGRIFLPKVGSINLAGVRFRDLHDVVSAALGRQYRGYTVAVSVPKLRGIRVYVTGFANNPGAYSVNSLSTLVNAVLAAGGPSGGGSFRSIKLFRNGKLVTDFDLYDMILRGDRSRDAVLQNEDVLYISPLGQQVAVTGSVNTEAVYEAREGDSIAALVGYAGGINDLADESRVLLYRLTEPRLLNGQQIERAQIAATTVMGGDILQVLSKGTLQRPIKTQAVLVRIEGEVNVPGSYFVPPNTTLAQVVAQAGGLTAQAFVFGTRLERLSVRRQQRQSFSEAIDQLEFSLLAAPLTTSSIGGGDRSAELQSARAALQKLRTAEPDGRIVMNLPFDRPELPGDLIIENNDRIVIPGSPVTVGVFGAVYRPASFLISDGAQLRIRDYVERAGGKLRSADSGAIIVVRANGDVLSRRRGAMDAIALPGDVVFVPIRTQSSSILAKIRDISAIIFQIGISAAAFVAIAR